MKDLINKIDALVINLDLSTIRIDLLISYDSSYFKW